jgi:hypothetical protein
MEQVLSMIPLALPGGASSSTTERPSTGAAEHRRLLVPDAFTNPEYRQFAIKGALAATICYLIFTGAAYPGIYTSWGGPVMAREAANHCDMAVAESFEALAAGIEGKQRRPWPDLAGALAELERSTAARLHDSTTAVTALHEHGRLALYRQLVPLVERLEAHQQGLVLA